MRTARGNSRGAPGARQDDRHAVRSAVLVGLALLLAGCAAESYSVPWQVQQPPARYMAPPPSSVQVQSGDTLYGISRRYGVPMKGIIQTNNLQPPYTLHVGQALVMPRPLSHVVRRGDTLYGIARTYQVDMNAMARINRLEPPYLIQVGQFLMLPDSDQEPRRGAGTVQTAATPVSAPKPGAKPTAPAAPRAEPQVADSGAPSRTATATPSSKPAASRPTVTAKPPAPPARTASAFAWPLSGKVVSRFGGKADGSRNDGINIAASRGATVKAAENGVVVYAGNELKGFGNLLLVKHADDWMTAYAHNELLTVKKGDTVKRGQAIARVGSTGNVSTPQLHFEIRRGSKAVDPLDHLGRQMASRE